MESKITINGKTYRGNTISISGNKVSINGKTIDDDSKIINITVEGDLGSIESDCCNTIQIRGSVFGEVRNKTGDIDIQGAVNGDVSSKVGDINCGNVAGNARTKVGDIKYRK